MFSHSSGSCPCWTFYQHNQDFFSGTKKNSKALEKIKMTPNLYETQSTHIFSVLTVSPNARLSQNWIEKHTRDGVCAGTVLRSGPQWGTGRWGCCCPGSHRAGEGAAASPLLTQEQQHSKKQGWTQENSWKKPDCTQSPSQTPSSMRTGVGGRQVTWNHWAHSGHGSFTSRSAAKPGGEVAALQSWPSAPPSTAQLCQQGRVLAASPSNLISLTSAPFTAMSETQKTC